MALALTRFYLLQSQKDRADHRSAAPGGRRFPWCRWCNGSVGYWGGPWCRPAYYRWGLLLPSEACAAHGTHSIRNPILVYPALSTFGWRARVLGAAPWYHETALRFESPEPTGKRRFEANRQSLWETPPVFYVQPPRLPGLCCRASAVHPG